MASLEEINKRWEARGLPHVLSGPDELHQVWCPKCETHPDKPKSTLHGALNDAIAHKYKCPAVES